MDSLGDTASMFEDEGFFSPEEDASFSRYAGPTPSYDSRAAVPKPRKTATKSPMNATQVSYGDSEGPTDSEEAEGDFDESSAEMYLHPFVTIHSKQIQLFLSVRPGMCWTCLSPRRRRGGTPTSTAEESRTCLMWRSSRRRRST